MLTLNSKHYYAQMQKGLNWVILRLGELEAEVEEDEDSKREEDAVGEAMQGPLYRMT